MPVATAIAIGASAQATAAALEAHQARVTACTKYVQGYTNDGATTAQRQEYASCVATLYPQPLTEGDTYVVKGALVLMFLGIAAGIWYARKQSGWMRSGVIDYAMFALIGGLCLPLAAAIPVGLFMAARFILT